MYMVVIAVKQFFYVYVVVFIIYSAFIQIMQVSKGSTFF